MRSYLHLSVASAPRYQRLRLNSLRRGTEGDQITGIVSIMGEVFARQHLGSSK